LAQAKSQSSVDGCCIIVDVSATAKTTYNGVSAESTLEAFGGSLEAIAQGGSGQFPDNPGVLAFAFSTALPNAAYATSLIGSASKVADALLGPDHTILGTTILSENGAGSSTFDFSFRGDLLLGVVAGGFVSVALNGDYFLSESVGDNTVINLGSIFGPNIDLTIEGEGTFAFGGAVPEPATWAMMLIGFAGLGYAGWRAQRNAVALAA
jgi:hypothetical protein